MFNFNGHLQELRANIVSIVLLLSATIIGFVWISIGIYHWLSACLGAVWGPIVLGLIFFIPIIIFAFIKAFVRSPLPQNKSPNDHCKKLKLIKSTFKKVILSPAPTIYQLIIENQNGCKLTFQLPSINELTAIITNFIGGNQSASIS